MWNYSASTSLRMHHLIIFVYKQYYEILANASLGKEKSEIKWIDKKKFGGKREKKG